MKYNRAKWKPEEIDLQKIDSELARSDDFIFYVATASSFLESTVPEYVKSLSTFFKDDQQLTKWLKEIWEPEEVNHGRVLRSYIEHVWPEYGWEQAYSNFLNEYLKYCKVEFLRPTCALEMHARCITETGAANFYRMVHNYVREPVFKYAMKNMFQDEVRHYTVFFDKFQKYNKKERLSFIQKFKNAYSRNEVVSNRDLFTTFQHINSGWQQNSPFKLKEYSSIITDIREMSQKYFPYDMAKNMLFRPFEKRTIFGKISTKILEKLCKLKLKGLIA